MDAEIEVRPEVDQVDELDEDFDIIPYILNEKNKLITSEFVSSVLKEYGIDYKVKNLELYQHAVTHTSYLVRDSTDSSQSDKLKVQFFRELEIEPIENVEDVVPLQQISYRKLENLGTAVIHQAITVYIFNRYEESDEGFMTRLRTKMENDVELTKRTIEFGLNEYILLSKKQELSGGREKNYRILGAVFKSFVAVLFYESGYNYKLCEKLIVNVIEKNVDIAELLHNETNYKDCLLRYYHQMRWDDPVYGVYDNEGPDHNMIFSMYVKDNRGKVFTVGHGTSKKMGEQEAAKLALQRYGVLKSDSDTDSDEENEQPVQQSKYSKKQFDTTPYILNEKNRLITKRYVDSVLKKYGLDHKTKNLKMFQRAVTHDSYIIETPEMYNKSKNRYKKAQELDVEPIKDPDSALPLQEKSYERLEFLGDAVLHLAVTTYIYERYHNESSGFMTITRAKIEKKESFAELTRKMNLDKYILLSRKIEQKGCRLRNDSIAEDAFEAFIAALFLETDYETCYKFTVNIIQQEIDMAEKLNSETNYKDCLLRYHHEMKWPDPVYSTYVGTSRRNKNAMCVRDKDGQVFAVGHGSCKKKGEQEAARQALIKYGKIKEEESSDEETDSDEEEIPYESGDEENEYEYNNCSDSSSDNDSN